MGLRYACPTLRKSLHHHRLAVGHAAEERKNYRVDCFGDESAWSITTRQISLAAEALLQSGLYKPSSINRDTSTIGTVYVFAPMAIATCVNLGLDPTAAAAAIVVSGWCGHFLPIDGMPAMIMGAGDYKITEFWKFTIPQYFIRLLALTVGAVLIFPMK